MPKIMFENGKLVLIPQSEEEWRKSFRRTLIFGPPTSGKTTSFLTFPPKRRVIVFPGELGYSSLIEDADTKVYYWEIDKEIRQEDATRLKTQVRKVIESVLSEEDTTFIGLDGVHKLMSLIYVSLGWPNDPSNFGDKAYGRGHNFARAEFNSIMQSVLLSKTPYVAATCYDGSETIEGGGTAIYPDLPGQMAKGVVGMFPCCFHQSKADDGSRQVFKWQLKSLGKIHGAGMHIPKQIRDAFPTTINADWNEVEKILDSIKEKNLLASAK